VPGILAANHPHHAISANDAAVLTDWLYRRFYLHDNSHSLIQSLGNRGPGAIFGFGII